MIGIFLDVRAFTRYHLAGVEAYLLAILPALPILGMIVAVGIYLAEEKDEFQRNLFIQAMVWGIGATLAVTTVCGCLENFTGTAHLGAFWIFPMYWAFVGVSSTVLSLRYR